MEFKMKLVHLNIRYIIDVFKMIQKLYKLKIRGLYYVINLNNRLPRLMEYPF